MLNLCFICNTNRLVSIKILQTNKRTETRLLFVTLLFLLVEEGMRKSILKARKVGVIWMNILVVGVKKQVFDMGIFSKVI